MPASSKHGLGRGLGALIPPPREPRAESGIQQVEVSQIAPNPRQPRRHIAPDTLDELAASIREHGLLQPLLLTPLPSPNGPTSAPHSENASPRYQLIAGERRWRAAQRAGLQRVPAIIKGATPQQMLELALVENIQRADLNPLEEAEAYRQLMDGFGLTQEQVAQRVGKDRTTVSNALRLLKLPDALKQAVNDEQISEGHARALLQLNDETKQRALLKTIVARKLSVRQTEELVRRFLDVAPNKTSRRGTHTDDTGQAGANRSVSTETRALEEDFRRALGTKVELYRSNRGGKIVIEFYSDEELDAIYYKLVH